MSNIYRKVPAGGLLKAGDEVVAHNGNGWVFGIVEGIDFEEGKVEIKSTTEPMLSVEDAQKKAGVTAAEANIMRRGIKVAQTLLASTTEEVEEFDTDEWPRTDRIEKRLLPGYDPLGYAIKERLTGSRHHGGFVWLTTRWDVGGYSEYTQEDEFALVIELEGHRVEFMNSCRPPLESLLRWLDGDDFAPDSWEKP